MPDARKDEAKAMIAAICSAAQPVTRGGQGEDIANMVAFLASSDASFITGTHMVVDGGITAGPRHAWDPNSPSLFDALIAMETAAQ